MCAVFGRGRRPRPKIPAGTAHPPLAAGGPPGGVSFAYFSLHKQRKVGPPRQAAPCWRVRQPSRQAVKARAAACLSKGPMCARTVDSVAPHPNPSPDGRGVKARVRRFSATPPPRPEPPSHFDADPGARTTTPVSAQDLPERRRGTASRDSTLSTPRGTTP